MHNLPLTVIMPVSKAAWDKRRGHFGVESFPWCVGFPMA